MELMVQIIFAMVLLEFLELYLHKADTLAEMIDKLYTYYKQSVFIFFLVHPAIYYVLGVLIYLDAFNFYGITILIIKFFDIFFKIEIIKQRYFIKNMDSDLEKMMRMKITPSMRFLSLLMHVPLLYMAIFSNLG